MIVAVRMLAYDCPFDLHDEYVQIGKSITIESLKRPLRDAVIGILKKYNYENKTNMIFKGCQKKVRLEDVYVRSVV